MNVSLEIPDEWREELKKEIENEIAERLLSEPPAEDVLRVKDAAKLLNVSEWSVYQMIRNNDDFPTIQVGRKTRILRTELLDWLKSRRYVFISDFDGGMPAKGE